MSDYNESWWLEGWGFVDEPFNNAYGFVYLITINGMEYIGSKKFFTQRKKHFGKKKLESITDKRLKTYEYVIKESNWKSYCSSSDEVKALVLAGHEPVRRILRICYSAKEMSFYENKYIYKVIGEDNCLNANVSGNYYLEEILKWQKI